LSREPARHGAGCLGRPGPGPPVLAFKSDEHKEIAMTKADLIEEVSRVVEMTRKESEVIVEAIFDSIVRSLRSGDKIEIRGFGSFRTRQRQPRIGRNPKTGARVEVPAKKIPYFKPSKELKDVVNNSAAQPVASSVPDAPEQTPNL
jgi:integration host factor subunit beta